MNLIIYGGSFNPVTNAHLEVAELALNFRGHDSSTVLWSPTIEHAFGKKMAPLQLRIEMICKAVYELKGHNVIKVGMGKYMYDYLALLSPMKSAGLCGNIELLIGSDLLAELPKWYKYQALIDEYHFLVAVRNEAHLKDLTVLKNYSIIGKVKSQTSSTEVRERIRNGESIDGFVHDNVRDIIERMWGRFRIFNN